MFFNKEKVRLFLTVFAISLAITLPLFIVLKDFGSLPIKYVVINSAFAVLIAALAAFTLLTLDTILTKRFRGLFYRLLAKISILTLARATRGYGTETQALGIGNQSGSLVIRIPTQPIELVTIGDQYVARNIASRKALGVLEVIEVTESSFVCSVFDRMDSIEFWEELENRMVRDPSPPSGVTFVREINQAATEYVIRVLSDWGDKRWQ